MEQPEYMRLKISDMPNNIIEQYKLNETVTPNGYVNVKIQEGMYGLPQAGIISQQLMEKRLNAKGYYQSKITPGFSTHKWRPISFSLYVYEFEVKYVWQEYAKHLLTTINQHYDTLHEWEGEWSIGLAINWDYPQLMVHISMPNYCKKASKRFQHEIPKKRQNQPYPHTKLIYAAKQQYAKKADTSPPLNDTKKTFIQEVIGVFLYYAIAVACTMICALGSLASQQETPNQKTMKK